MPGISGQHSDHERNDQDRQQGNRRHQCCRMTIAAAQFRQRLRYQSGKGRDGRPPDQAEKILDRDLETKSKGRGKDARMESPNDEAVEIHDPSPWSSDAGYDVSTLRSPAVPDTTFPGALVSSSAA